MKLDQKKLEQLKGEYGELYAITIEGIELIVRPPTRESYRRFAKRAQQEPFLAAEELLRDCVVWPDPAEVDAILARRPGIVAPISEHVIRLAGALSEASFRTL